MELIFDSSLSAHYLFPRMDVLDPGDVLPGRVGFTFSLVKFIGFVGSLVDTRSEANAALLQYYGSAMNQISAFPPGSVFHKPIFLCGDLLTLLIKRESGTDPMTVDLVRAFLAHMIARLSLGGYEGIYVAYLRQARGPAMFSAKLQSNAYWLSKGIGGLPGTIGLAALGFKA